MEFSIGSAIRFGWETFKKRPWLFVGASVVIALAYLVVGSISVGIDVSLTGSLDETTVAGAVVDWILSALVSMGVVAFYLKAHDNTDAVSLSSLWHPHPFWNYFAATIVVGIAIVLGLLLLIVPGIIFALMFMFATIIVIDRERGPIEAMKESMRVTRGYKWSLLGFALVLALLNVLGLLAFVVGLLVSIPVSLLAFMHAYRTLAGRAVPSRAVADATL
jgi:uncharacterized membrane protein